MSTRYNLDDIILPAGTLKLSFINNVGSGTVAIAGSRLLNIAEVSELVEENGIGGVIRIPDIKIELFDKGGTFHDTIFASPGVTRCDVSIKLNVGGTDYGIMLGYVDLPTINYPSYYDDESGTESHSCNFVVFSPWRTLSTILMSSLRTNMVAHSVNDPDSNKSLVFVIDILTEILKAVSGSSTSATLLAAQTYIHDIGGGFTALETVTANQLFFYFYLDRTIPSYATLWQDSSTYSWMNFGDVGTFLTYIASVFLCYPVFTYDAATEKLELHLKQRGGNDVRTSADLPILKETTEDSFLGYDAIRVYRKTDVLSGVTGIVILPTTISNDQFGLLLQKFDFICYNVLNSYDTNSFVQTSFVMLNSQTTHFGNAEFVHFNALNIPDYNNFLVTAFAGYWFNKGMFVRKYGGAGIGATKVLNILDSITINGVNYVTVDIKRNLVTDEMTVKAAKY